jgi:hypothetical protein
MYKFSTYSNWLVPDHVMVGRYPFVEPNRCRSRDMGQAQLSDLLDARITTFVSLLAELPSQEDVPADGLGGFLPYKATVDQIVGGMRVSLSSHYDIISSLSRCMSQRHQKETQWQ